MYKVSTKSLRRRYKKKRNMMYSISSLHVPTCMYQVKIFGSCATRYLDNIFVRILAIKIIVLKY